MTNTPQQANTKKTKPRNFFAEWNEREHDAISGQKAHEFSFTVSAFAVDLINKGLDRVSGDRA